jgi:uncharacterized membrane-anchored protein YjiN (DUF445 family)
MKDENTLLEKMSEEEFERFRNKYLDKKNQNDRLTSEAMSGIRRALALQDYDTLRVKCDEKHIHSLNCVEYDSRYACIIDRLIEEIRDYRLYLKRISSELASGA